MYELYVVLGYIMPTELGRGFTILLFDKIARSNSVFVQKIDRHGIVVGLQEFDIGGLAIQPLETQPRVAIGQPALFGFRDDERSIALSKHDLTDYLEVRKHIYSNDRFLYLHVCEFCKSDDAHQARRKAFQILKDEFSRFTAPFWRDAVVLAPMARRYISDLIEQKGRDLSPFQLENTDWMMVDVRAVFNRSVLNIEVPRALAHVLSNINSDWQKEILRDISNIARDYGIETCATLILDGDEDGINVVKHQVTSERALDLDETKALAIAHFGKLLSTGFIKQTGSLYRDKGGTCRIVCTGSRRHTKRGCLRYWYGYHQSWHEFLKDGIESYLILVCRDRATYFAIPFSLINDIRLKLRTSRPDNRVVRHIDVISLFEDGNESYYIRSSESIINLEEYRLSFI